MKPLKQLTSLAALVLLGFSTAACADELERILGGEQAPPGVVFEIVSGDSDLLMDLLPELRRDIERLRKRFPGLSIAIVSHGQEQFALTEKNRKRAPELHSLASELVERQDVSLHVCGTYAQWYGIAAEEFPQYVDVAAAGPSQIKDYRALDYVVITLP